MIEFEMKIPADLSEVRDRLDEIGAEFIGLETNKDHYFVHPSRDFAKTDEALRIRQTNSEIILTYKGPKFDNRSKSRDEINIGIAKIDMVNVLEELGFQVAGTIIKKRETWKFRKVTVTLDTVRGLGEFVEMEIMGDHQKELDDHLSELKHIAQLMGLDHKNQITKSYLELWLEEQDA